MEEHRFILLENTVDRIVFGSIKAAIKKNKENWRIRNKIISAFPLVILDAWNEGLSDVWNFQSQCGRWEFYATFFGGKPQMKRILYRHRWGDKIQTNLRNLGH